MVGIRRVIQNALAVILRGDYYVMRQSGVRKGTLCLHSSRASDLSFVDPVRYDGRSRGDTSKWINESRGVLHESIHLGPSSIVWLRHKFRSG